jgi:hypothetical protein
VIGWECHRSEIADFIGLLANFYAAQDNPSIGGLSAAKDPKGNPTMALKIDRFKKTFSNLPLIGFGPLKKLIFYIVHSKYVTKTQKYVKIVGREPSFFHHQRPAGVLALFFAHRIVTILWQNR